MKQLLVGFSLALAVWGVRAADFPNDDGVIRTWSTGALLPSRAEVEADPSKAVVVLTDTQLADVEIVSSVFNGNPATSEKLRTNFGGIASPFHVTRTATELAADLMAADCKSGIYGEPSTWSVRVVLYQSGADVCACVTEAFCADGRNVPGYDLSEATVQLAFSGKSMSLATPDSSGVGCGIDQLTFSVKAGGGKKAFEQTAALAADEALSVGTNVSVTADMPAVFSGLTSVSNAITLAPGAELAFVNPTNGMEVCPRAFGSAATLTFRRTAEAAATDLPVSPVVATDTNVVNITRIPNTLLASVTNVTVRYGKKLVNAQGWQTGVQVWHFTNTGVTATFQAQYKQDNLRGVLVSMKQDGEDIVLSNFAARGKSGADFGYCFGQAGEATFNSYRPEYETDLTKNYLAIRGVTLYCDDGIVNVGPERVAVKRICNVSLASVTNVCALYGKGLGEQNTWLSPTATYFFQNDGQTATGQIQWLHGANNLRGQIVTLRQDGADVTVDYDARFGGGDLGTDLKTLGTATNLDGLGAWGLCMKGLYLQCNCPQTGLCRPYPDVSLTAGALGLTNGLVRVDGIQCLSITNTSYTVNPSKDSSAYKRTFQPLLPPSGWYEATNGAEIVVENWGESGQGGYGYYARCGFRAHKDSRIILADRNWVLDDYFPFDLNGGELRLGGRNPTSGSINQYVNRMMFRDGARLTGRSPNIGYIHHGDWYVSGSEPSFCEVDLKLSGRYQTGTAIVDYRWLKLTVDDVTGDDRVDFTIDGAVRMASGTSNPFCGVWKLGAGTAKLAKACTYEGSTRAEGGTLLLGVSQCLLQTNEISVAGGALAFAAGTSTTFDNLSFGAGTDTLVFGEGATLNLTKVGYGEDVGAIHVNGSVGPTTCRFGTRVPTAIRKTKFFLNGARAMLDADGYVVPFVNRGLQFIVH